jgi:serine/threonine protein kinase
MPYLAYVSKQEIICSLPVLFFGRVVSFFLLGQGVLPDSQEIAVKRLGQTSRQGIGELKSELVLIAKLHHKNLVRLVGVCLEEHEKILVYEYMPNRSLDTILFSKFFPLMFRNI